MHSSYISEYITCTYTYNIEFIYRIYIICRSCVYDIHILYIHMIHTYSLSLYIYIYTADLYRTLLFFDNEFHEVVPGHVYMSLGSLFAILWTKVGKLMYVVSLLGISSTRQYGFNVSIF